MTRALIPSAPGTAASAVITGGEVSVPSSHQMPTSLTTGVCSGTDVARSTRYWMNAEFRLSGAPEVTGT